MREITLIGQDTTCYGEDFGLKDGLALLLEKLARSKTCAGFVFSTPIPTKSRASLLDTIAAHEKICSYMDVPLQHASASVLKRMKRGGGADVFLRSIAKMRRAIPDVTLADLVHCWLSRRDRKGIRRALRFRPRGPIRLDGRIRLFRSGRRRRLRISTRNFRRVKSSAGAST